MIRAEMLKIKMLTVMMSAPAQARFCHSLYGLNANWKITTGRLAMGAFKFVLQN